MSYLLGVDVGTTNVKAVAFDEDGHAQARMSVKTPTTHEGPGRWVHDPQALWDAVARVISTVVGQLASPTEIVGVGVASMAEEGFPIDAQGRALYPGILWHDERTSSLVAWWQHEVGNDRLYEITGLPLQHIYTALKLQWLYRHEPDVMASTAMWLPVSDFIAYRLGGRAVTSPSQASRTMLLDLAAGTWSRELLTAGGIPESILPEIVPSGTVVGGVPAQAAEVTRLALGTPVAVGGHDHICGCLACGAIEDGALVHSGGTAEAFVRVLGRPDLRPASPLRQVSQGRHVVPDRYYAVGGHHSGGAVGWWTTLLKQRRRGDLVWDTAAASAPGAKGLVFLPYLYGKGPPDPDAGATAALLGLTADHDVGDVLRAVIEGVCYDAVDIHRLLAGRDTMNPIVAIGGLTNIGLWLELKAEILDAVVRVPEGSDAVAHGAALLAGLGTGVYTDVASMLERTVRFSTEIQPRRELVDVYRKLYEDRYVPARARVTGAVPRES